MGIGSCVVVVGCDGDDGSWLLVLVGMPSWGCCFCEEEGVPVDVGMGGVVMSMLLLLFCCGEDDDDDQVERECKSGSVWKWGVVGVL